MRYLVCLTTLTILTMSIPVRAVELLPLADCSLKVFREINKSHVWSGRTPPGCPAKIHVEKRPNGIFVTAWQGASSERGWVRLSFSAAMGFSEVADRKALDKAGRDITARARRIGTCLDSILRLNDPLECRDHAAKIYSVGEETGTEFQRTVWLDDNGRHAVAEYVSGDTAATDSPPADLFSAPALPPGTKLDLPMVETR